MTKKIVVRTSKEEVTINGERVKSDSFGLGIIMIEDGKVIVDNCDAENPIINEVAISTLEIGVSYLFTYDGHTKQVKQ